VGCAHQTEFFTVVTIRSAKDRWPFQIEAWVLYTGAHALYLDPTERRCRLLQTWGWIKKEFGKQALPLVGTAHPTPSAQAKREIREIILLILEIL